MTTEQGMPLAEARIETLACADILDWLAEEARRNYGRVIPARSAGVEQIRDPRTRRTGGGLHAVELSPEPVGQKDWCGLGGRLLGCDQGPRRTPASVMDWSVHCRMRVFQPGVVNLVFGVPAFVSDYLIRHPAIRRSPSRVQRRLAKNWQPWPVPL